MGLPIHLNHRPVVWRTNPLIIPIRCWLDRQKTQGVDLTRFGFDWVAHVRPATYDAPPVVDFVTDTTEATAGGLTLTLDAATVQSLPRPDYVFDIVVTDADPEPLTVFVGSFTVAGF